MNDYTRRPWEDALILAFRDMQWIRKIQHSESSAKDHLAMPPGLMLKLDGKAETATGDVIAGYNQRFFLFEFKAALELSYTEKNKRIYDLLANVSPMYPDGAELLELSGRGHFFVYPRTKESLKNTGTSFFPLHHITLMAAPYIQLVCEYDDEKLEESSKPLDETFHGNGNGLDLEEMSQYLASLLAQAEGSGGDDAPLKAVIASPDGMFWPIGSLSDFMSFVQSVEPLIYRQPQQNQSELLQLQTWGDDGDEPSRAPRPRGLR